MASNNILAPTVNHTTFLKRIHEPSQGGKQDLLSIYGATFALPTPLRKYRLSEFTKTKRHILHLCHVHVQNDLVGTHGARRKGTLFVSTIVLLSGLPGVKVVLGLGHSVTVGGTLLPGLTGISSSLHVEFSVIFKDSSLLYVLLVVGTLLLVISVTDGLVLSGAQTGRDVRVASNLSRLDLLQQQRQATEKSSVSEHALC
jgi:hypothetical protein